MDNGTITIILWSCIVGFYACYKFYKFGHSLNPYDFSKRK